MKKTIVFSIFIFLFIFMSVIAGSELLNASFEIPKRIYHPIELIKSIIRIESYGYLEIEFGIKMFNSNTHEVILYSQLQRILLQPNKVFNSTQNILVPDNIPEGEYILEFDVNDISGNLLKRLSINFNITETKLEIPFSMFICKDSSCIEKSKVFILNQEIFLDYESSIPGSIITGYLIYPDKTTKQISLPTLIKANQIGTYNVKITTSKLGYKTSEKTIQFGVIKEEAKIPIPIFPSCNPDGTETDGICYKGCGADSQCDGRLPRKNWCDGNINKTCSSTCKYSEINCKNYGSNYICSGGRCILRRGGGGGKALRMDLLSNSQFLIISSVIVIIIIVAIYGTFNFFSKKE